MKRLLGVITMLFGIILIAPSLLIVLFAGIMLISLMFSAGTIGTVSHISFFSMGEITSGGKVVVPGWVTQLGTLAFAVLGVYLVICGVGMLRDQTGPNDNENHY